jgi:hypothetical protein
MKNLATAAASFLLLLPLLIHQSHGYGHAKQLPPAFGVELVPDKSAQEPSDPSQSEIIEEKEERQEKRQRAASPRRNRGQRLKIQLDGDEDGGGVDGDEGDF